MGKFNIEGNLTNIKKLMSIMGLWPEQSSSVPYKVLGFTTMFIITSFTVTTVTEAFKFVDIESTSFALCCAISSSLTIVKYFVLFTKKESLFNLMKMLDEPVLSLHSDHLDVFLIKKMRMCRFFQSMHIFSAVGTGTLIIIIPMLETNSERPIPVPFPVDMKDQSFIVYILVWWFESSAVLLTTMGIGCFDGLLFFFMIVAAAELKILREKIVEATNFASSDSKKVDNAVNNLLKHCILHHIAIERYIIQIQTTFTNAFLIQLIMSLLITCFLGFTLILIPVKSVEFGMCILFFVAAATQLIFFCVPGNEITLQSTKIGDACYMSQWVNCGPPVRKTLFIIMERAKRPFQLSAGNFVELSLETLIRVLKSGFSYFTVLKRMYGDSRKV